MKPYQLFQGDCNEILQQLPTESIDIVMTDIPYGIDYSEWDTLHANTNNALGGASIHQAKDTSFKRRGKPINGWSRADKQIPIEYQAWCETWATELYRVTKEGSPILIFSSRRLQHRVAQALENQGFLVRDVLIWKKDKCNAKAQRIAHTLIRRGIEDPLLEDYRLGNLAPYYEPIIYAMKPYRKTLTDCAIEAHIGGFYAKDGNIPSIILECPTNKRNLYHETEKPVVLMERLVEIFSVDPTHVILDFCMGSGTTGVATGNKQRHFIGIERDEHYFKLATQRIETAYEMN